MTINHTTQLKHWNIEIKQMFLRKTDEYGNSYSASCVINIVNGNFVIELMNGEKLNSSELLEIRTLAKSMGFDSVTYNRNVK